MTPPEVPTPDIGVADPRDHEVGVLLARHLEFSRSCTPPDAVFALDVDALLDRRVTLFGARRGGRLLGIGGIKELDAEHGEVKSMHTAAGARGRGIGRALVEHLLAIATERGYRRVSLETGSQPEFAPARQLYAACGFVPCGPFAAYPDSPTSAFMTIDLG
jgi:putative acetyltransferase